jgi:Raf kinase inhibitor-like YbhB/YbcL family protein
MTTRTRRSLSGWILWLSALAFVGCSSTSATPGIAHPALSVSSPALTEGKPIPAAYACTDYDHLGKSPPLSWAQGPEGTAAYAITVTDPDAKNFVHWALIGVPAGTTSLPEGASPLPAGATELPNDFDKPGYGGPCPPPGSPHHYLFRVYALKTQVTASKPDANFFKALDAAALAVGTITVTFQR